jgi:GGDEF domain-containing protein
VAGRTDLIDLEGATRRLEEIVATFNAGEADAFPVTFSLGYVISDPDSKENAGNPHRTRDAIMYQAKRDKKRTRGLIPA